MNSYDLHDYFILLSDMGSYLGQNFLIDAKVRSYIAEHIAKMYTAIACEALIEIGPGKGAITRLIEHISDNFFVIEKDTSLAGSLKLDAGSKTVIQGDVLEVDVGKMLEAGSSKPDTKKTLVVGNLPYYITSPILRKFFGNGGQDYAGGIFMVQDEVGQKLRHDAKKKSYLWRLLNYAYEVHYLKGVPAKCFKPAPKVKSCLIEIKMNNEQGIMNNVGWEKFIQFLELYAPFSRKTLGAIEKIVEKRDMESNRQKLRKVEEYAGNSGERTSKFIIPETLKKKRLEELSFQDLERVLSATPPLRDCAALEC